MANKKTGFAYYSADTDRFQDIRIKRLKKDRGCTGFAVYEYILSEIYRVKGCYIIWDENTVFDVAEYWAIEEDVVNDIVQYCLSVGLFDNEMLRREGVLTSRSIQSRFIEMSNSAKRKDFEIPEQYEIITEECNDNSCSLPQRKVKKSKVKESKEIYSDFSFVDEPFKKAFFDWLEYKKTRKEQYKTQQTLEACYCKLIRLSRGDPNIAELIIEESLANNWAGFYELKNNSQNGQNITGKSKSDRESEERKDFISRKAAAVFAELRDRAAQ